jgi:hypothetical protein
MGKMGIDISIQLISDCAPGVLVQLEVVSSEVQAWVQVPLPFGPGQNCSTTRGSWAWIQSVIVSKVGFVVQVDKTHHRRAVHRELGEREERRMRAMQRRTW